MEKYWELKKILSNGENQEVINDFLLSLKLANRSQMTIKNYRQLLERFFGNRKESFSALTSSEIILWFKQNYGHLKESTFHTCLSILSSFYKFCVQEGYLERSPIKNRWYPRLPEPIPKYLGKRDIAITRQHSEKMSLRNQVLVEFMFTSGCRVGEVHQLNKVDVDLENRIARVVGKGRKIRDVHFSEKCAILMERYFFNHPSEALFIKSSGERLGIAGIQDVIRKLGKEANLPTSLHPHRFRHTFATEMLAKGAELTFIADELGHANLRTTQIYARLPNSEIMALYRKYMG